MRTKLGLTDTELMQKSWIQLNLEMADFPYYDYKKEKVIKGSDPFGPNGPLAGLNQNP